MEHTVYIVCHAILCASAAFIIYSDLRWMKIHNKTIGILLVTFVVLWGFGPDIHDIKLRLITAAITFGLGFFAFAIGVMGGGDVKLLPVLALFTPFHMMPNAMFVLAGCLLAAILFVVIIRKFATVEESQWGFRTTQKLPMGLGIGPAILITVLLSMNVA